MKLDNKSLQIEALFYKGEPSHRIAKIVGYSSATVSNVIDEILKKNSTNKHDKLDQIKAIEKELFRKIEQHYLYPNEKLNKKIDELAMIYKFFKV